MADASVCPKCGGSLRPYDRTGDHSARGYLIAELILAAILLSALAAPWLEGILNFVILAVAIVAVIVGVFWVRRQWIHRPRHGLPAHLSCDRCRHVFAHYELGTAGSHANNVAP